MNILVQVCVWEPVSSSLGYIPRGGIARSYGSSVLFFLKNFHTVSTEAAIFHISSKRVMGFLKNHTKLQSQDWNPSSSGSQPSALSHIRGI